MSYDLLTLGRVSLDLFSESIGAPFVEIEGFETSVGGSPTNIAIGTSRLGLKVAALTAVGNDPVGDFVLHSLKNEGVDTQFIPRKDGTRTPLAVVGVEPPDKFPLQFYRENPADIHFSIEDIEAAPVAESRALLLSGTALSRGSCRDATLYAAENGEPTIFIDLDLRPDQWAHPRAYGLNIRTILQATDVVIGTEEEFYAALSPQPEPIMQGQLVQSNLQEELETLLEETRQTTKEQTLIVKRGAKGVSVFTDEQTINVPGFPVEILNTVGAGDAFASGLIYARLEGQDWYSAARFANACGAIVVTRQGCSRALPHVHEVEEFMQAKENNT